MAPAKEVHIFDSPTFDAGQIDARYAAALPNYGGQRCVMEATPSYLYLPDVPGRIAQYNPAMRVIVLLRDPVERAVSHHHMERARVRVAPAAARAGGRADSAPRGRTLALVARVGATAFVRGPRLLRCPTHAAVRGVPARAGAGAEDRRSAARPCRHALTRVRVPRRRATGDLSARAWSAWSNGKTRCRRAGGACLPRWNEHCGVDSGTILRWWNSCSGGICRRGRGATRGSDAGTSRTWPQRPGREVRRAYCCWRRASER